MDYVFASVIIVATLGAAWTAKINTDGWCLHLLWVASTTAAIFLTTSNYNALIFSVLFVIISAMYLAITELFRVLAQIKS